MSTLTFTIHKGHQIVIKLKDSNEHTHPSMWNWEYILGESIFRDTEYITVDGRMVHPVKEETKLR